MPHLQQLDEQAVGLGPLFESHRYRMTYLLIILSVRSKHSLLAKNLHDPKYILIVEGSLEFKIEEMLRFV